MANVTYRGTTIGKVTAVEPTERGAKATMSIDSRYKIPVDASADVHSVSAIGEQYLDLVSTGNPGQYNADGQSMTDNRRRWREPGGDPETCSYVPSEVGPALDVANEGLAVLPKEKIDALLTETALAVVDWARPATAGRLDGLDRQRFPRQPEPGQRHHRELGADSGQPGELR